MKKLSLCSTHRLLVETLANLHINIIPSQNKTKHTHAYTKQQNSAPCPKLHIFLWTSEKCLQRVKSILLFQKNILSLLGGSAQNMCFSGKLITSHSNLTVSILKYTFMIKIASSKMHSYRVIFLKQWFLVSAI